MNKTAPLTSFWSKFKSDWRWADFNSYTLIGLIFSIPFSTSLSSILAAVILAGWLLKGDFKRDWDQIRSSQLIIACLFFVGLHLVGLLWTSDLTHGLAVLEKQWKFLLIPIAMCCVKREHVNFYMGSLILAMTISVMISYGIWLEIIPPIGKGTVYNPVPFRTHITYNVLLAIAIYLLARSLLFDPRASLALRGSYLLILAMMVVNMFITGGRSGQVMFFVAVAVLCFQYFPGQSFKAGAATIVVVLSILAAAFSFSDLFRQRFLEAVSNSHVSTKERLAYAVGGLKIFARHPLIGVGTGDLPAELKKIDPHQNPGFYAGNPHNMYIMALVQFGILGLASLLYIFYVQIRHALGTRHVTLRQVGVAIPLLFLVVNFGESYLSVHATSLLFAAFSSFLYKDF